MYSNIVVTGHMMCESLSSILAFLSFAVKLYSIQMSSKSCELASLMRGGRLQFLRKRAIVEFRQTRSVFC